MAIVEVHHVYKKFCRHLKRSLWYGVKDITTEMLARNRSPALRREEFWALKDVCFSVRPGESVSILGLNGTGKSTLLKIINGLYPPDAGHVTLNGTTGALLELGTGFKEVLSARENIYINAAILGMPAKIVHERIDAIIEFAEVEQFVDTPLLCFSSGMKMRLGFSIAAHLKPQLLLLDEILAVGDEPFRKKCLTHLKTLIKQGTTLMMVSHNHDDLSQLTQRGLVLSAGELIFDGPFSEALDLYRGSEPSLNETSIPAQQLTPPLQRASHLSP